MSEEICQGCEREQPNVGNWEDGRRLCGPCKFKITAARPGFAARLDEAIGGEVVMGGSVEELQRQAEEARKSWHEAMDKARSEGRKAAREAGVSMGVDALRAAYDAAYQRVSDHISKGLPTLLDGWTWDDDGRACREFPNETVLVDNNSQIVFEDHDDNEAMTRPIAVVRAVLAAEDSK